ncbi:hypothetical protein [Algibacter sp. 2305UL17-15]|uniref:hypothetical protein n=1 Tax=Algibacter sp. 2305UL17-15 TaxID=3231268 RepID=UPI0034576F15
MEYEKLNLQEKAKYLFNKFKVEFDKVDCSIEEPKESCKKNRLELTKRRYLPNNERVADIYNKLCVDYSEKIDCL